MRVHLVDGTYELFRAFYGPPSAKAPDGREVGATRALMRTLVTLIRDEGVTHIGCAFDHVIESFRNELFGGYKTGAGIDPDLYAQFPLAERATQALGIVTWPMVELEADDAIATAAARCAEQASVEQVVICSPDKDLAQCVRGERVVLLDRRAGRVLDEAAVTAKLGVSPALVPDYLALVGDAADGLPGVPRWGAKSAAKLLSHYGGLDRIPTDAARWDLKVRGAAALASQLAAHRDEALLYRRLATLRTDAPLAEDLEQLAWRGPDAEPFGALCAELGETELPGRLEALRGA